jgi:CHAT domain-containing protein
LISTKGLQAYKQTKISRTRLDTAISNLRGSLGVELLQATRAPHLRASFVFSRKNRQSSHLPLKRSVDEITRILLPEPIAHSLMSVEQLIVVPTLGIGTVPFPLLQPFGSSLMIVDQMSVSIAPSLFDIGQQIEPWDPAILESPKDSGRHYPALVVGNPYFLTYGDWVFPPLSGAEQEARAVARMLKVKPLIGKNATKKAVKTSAVRASILYFATHAGADASDGFLALSADSPDAEKWTGQEIHNSRFENAYLAVLSACQTGLGMVHDGGINGVARSFQMGGVPRVVMSLWRVDDAATAELMQHFIGHLKQGMPAEALRQAMLDERKRHPDPSQWASFVLFGTPR